MKNLKVRLKEELKKQVKESIRNEKGDWPPVCLGPFYQVRRPLKKGNN